MKGLKIIAVINRSESGGAQVAAVRVARGLQCRGHDVELWFLDQHEPVKADDLSTRVLLPWKANSALDYIRMSHRLCRALRAVSPDVVLSFLPRSNILAQTIARVLGVKTRVASQRNPAWSYGRTVKWLDRLAGSLGMYTSNIIVSESAAASFGSYPRNYRRSMTTVQNGIDFQYAPLSQAAARKQLGLPEVPCMLAAVGRLTDQKNHELLLRAMAGVDHVQLALAGDGELRNHLNAVAHEWGIHQRVHFLGTLQRSEVAVLLRAADIFAIPSRYEGMSNALLEALAAGVAIVSSDIPAQAEVLRSAEGASGVLVASDDVLAWTEAIRSLVNDPDLRQSLAASAKRRSADFTVETMIDGFEKTITADFLRK